MNCKQPVTKRISNDTQELERQLKNVNYQLKTSDMKIKKIEQKIEKMNCKLKVKRRGVRTVELENETHWCVRNKEGEYIYPSLSSENSFDEKCGADEAIREAECFYEEKWESLVDKGYSVIQVEVIENGKHPDSERLKKIESLTSKLACQQLVKTKAIFVRNTYQNGWENCCLMIRKILNPYAR